MIPLPSLTTDGNFPSHLARYSRYCRYSKITFCSEISFHVILNVVLPFSSVISTTSYPSVFASSTILIDAEYASASASAFYAFASPCALSNAASASLFATSNSCSALMIAASFSLSAIICFSTASSYASEKPISVSTAVLTLT